MIYQVTIVLFSIWSQFMVALEYFFDVSYQGLFCRPGVAIM